MRRLPEVLLVAALALVGVAMLLIPVANAAEEEGVAIPVDCGATVCVLPKAIWRAVMEGHNATVDENRRLKAELAALKGGEAPKQAPPCVMPRGGGA